MRDQQVRRVDRHVEGRPGDRDDDEQHGGEPRRPEREAERLVAEDEGARHGRRQDEVEGARLLLAGHGPRAGPDRVDEVQDRAHRAEQLAPQVPLGRGEVLAEDRAERLRQLLHVLVERVARVPDARVQDREQQRGQRADGSVRDFRNAVARHQVQPGIHLSLAAPEPEWRKGEGQQQQRPGVQQCHAAPRSQSRNCLLKAVTCCMKAGTSCGASANSAFADCAKKASISSRARTNCGCFSTKVPISAANRLLPCARLKASCNAASAGFHACPSLPGKRLMRRYAWANGPFMNGSQRASRL